MRLSTVAAIGLVFDRRFQPPFFVRAFQLDLVVAVLNDNAVDFIAIEIDDILGAPVRFFRVRPFAFEKLDENDQRRGEGKEDERGSESHSRDLGAPLPPHRRNRSIAGTSGIKTRTIQRRLRSAFHRG